MLHLLDRFQHVQDWGTWDAQAPKHQQNSNVSNPTITTPHIVEHDDCLTLLGSDKVAQEALIHAHFHWVHAFTAAKVVTGKDLSTFAIPHCLLSNQFEVGVAVDFTCTNGAVFLGVDVARLLTKLHIGAGLGMLVLVGVSSAIGKGAHGGIQLGQLWNFAVGFEHADVQTRATSCGGFL